MAFIGESHSNCPSYADEGNDMVFVKDELQGKHLTVRVQMKSNCPSLYVQYL